MPAKLESPLVIVLMGVSGSGKSTVGRALAASLHCSFYDGDDFHPEANVKKMSRGQPLTDADRYPWLETLHDFIACCLDRGESAVLACSALKKKYREQLFAGNRRTLLVYLRADYDLIQQRLESRRGHFMKAAMLRSQFESLEEPAEAVVVDVDRTVESTVAIIEQAVRASPVED